MADHPWEDHAEPAFSAAAWVLDQLEHELMTLDDNGESATSEFAVASAEVRGLSRRLTNIRNDCYTRRDGDDEDLEAMDRLMDDVGRVELTDAELAARKLKRVGKVHFLEDAYTGVEGGIGFLSVPIGNYLDGKRGWHEILEEVEGRVQKEVGEDWVVLKEEHGPFSARQEGGSYKFMIYNKRTNLMDEFTLLLELRDVDEEWPRVLDGQQASVKVMWNGINSERPGVIGVVSESYVWSFATTHFSNLIDTLEQMPAMITKGSLQKLGFKEI